MLRFLLIPAFLTLAGQVQAQACPDFFRFVDFGVQDREGRFQRGGPIFRAESLTGRSLLELSATQCRRVAHIASDGHGNPIPVVTRVTYDVDRLDIDLTRLEVSYAEDTEVAAFENARMHRRHLRQAASVKGAHSLCVALGEVMSCQVVSPYLRSVDLVVYCDPALCRMPVLAVAPRIVMSAEWEAGAALWAQPERAGEVIYQKLRALHGFFEPLTSGL